MAVPRRFKNLCVSLKCLAGDLEGVRKHGDAGCAVWMWLFGRVHWPLRRRSYFIGGESFKKHVRCRAPEGPDTHTQSTNMSKAALGH